ncbi:MAG: DUF3379 family protein [Xanthomonadales bacterium]
MNFSEFIRQLGAEPHSRDPAFLRARQSSPEFVRAAQEADAFEKKLTRAVDLQLPDDMMERILQVSRSPVETSATATTPWWRSMALAAGILIAVGAAGITWNMNRGWDNVNEYLADHYSHDGPGLVARAGEKTTEDIQAIFALFNVKAAPELAKIVSVIKYCPTPDGKGVHMVLNTSAGPVTVIYMPATEVNDRETLAFDGMHALLVSLEIGSAAIIGTGSQGISALYSVIQSSIIPKFSSA